MTCNSMGKYIYNNCSSSIPFFVFCVCLHFVFCEVPQCVLQAEIWSHIHIDELPLRLPFLAGLSPQPCIVPRADGFFLRACELVTISQVRRKFPRAEKVLFNTAPSFLTLTWPPCENRGRQFLTPRLKLVHRKPRAVCETRRPVELSGNLACDLTLRITDKF